MCVIILLTILILGKISTYTSGCLKNQNRCWNNTGSLLLTGSKKVVLKLRSKRSIVIHLASTGKESTKSKLVTAIAEGKRLLFLKLLESIIVTKKLILLIIELTPAKCKLKIK